MIECLPMQRSISSDGLVFAWLSFPEAAKQELEPIHLAYACTQRILDPAPDLNRAIHIQLLLYLYPVINGIPATDRGLRQDIAERMKSPHQFHPLVKREEAQLPALPPAPSGPPVETPQLRRKRLTRLAQLVRDESHVSSNPEPT